MTVRPANHADIAAISAIAAQAPTAAHWHEPDYQRLFTVGSHYLVLVYQESVVRGFLIASQVGPEWELENIAVEQSAQRLGVATALLGHFLDLVQQQRGAAVYLEVRASNTAARALYGQHGFTISGRRPQYYDNPAEDAILYKKAIAQPRK